MKKNLNIAYLNGAEGMIRRSGTSSGDSGGGSTPTAVGENDVTFYDYDGTVLYSYTKDEFLKLTEMPPLPTREGLICQEWNWSLEDAKDYVGKYGMQNIGATYITDNGETRIYVDFCVDKNNVPLNIHQTVTNGVTIDWGDGSPIQTIDGTGYVNTTHLYEKRGKYIIKLMPQNNCELMFGSGEYEPGVLGDSEIYCCSVYKCELGKNILDIGGSAFDDYVALQTIVIPKGVNTISDGTFDYCKSLQCLIVPFGVTNIETWAVYENGLKIMSVPKTITSNPKFNYCYKLNKYCIPEGSIIPDYMFSDTYCLEKVVIPNTIDIIVDGMFDEVSSINIIELPDTITRIEDEAFKYCESAKINIPNNVEYIGENAFSYCYGLKEVILPKTITEINNSSFYRCRAIRKMAFLGNITQIKTSGLNTMSDNMIFDMTNNTTIPIINASSDISLDPTHYLNNKLIVPDNLYDEWIAATNWSELASNIIKKSDYETLIN